MSAFHWFLPRSFRYLIFGVRGLSSCLKFMTSLNVLQGHTVSYALEWKEVWC